LYSDKDCQTKASVYMTGIPSKGTAVWDTEDGKTYYYLFGGPDMTSSNRSSVNVNAELVASQNKREVQYATCPLVFAVKKVVDIYEDEDYYDYACYIGGVYVGGVSGASMATGMVHGKVIKACQELAANPTAGVADMLEKNEYFPIRLYEVGSLPGDLPTSRGFYESVFRSQYGGWVPRSFKEVKDEDGTTITYSIGGWGAHIKDEWYMDEPGSLLAIRYVPMVEISHHMDLGHAGGLAYGGHVCSLTSSLPSDQEEGFFPVWYTPKVEVEKQPVSGMYIRQ
jgi:hypothetical protein